MLNINCKNEWLTNSPNFRQIILHQIQGTLIFSMCMQFITHIFVHTSNGLYYTTCLNLLQNSVRFHKYIRYNIMLDSLSFIFCVHWVEILGNLSFVQAQAIIGKCWGKVSSLKNFILAIGLVQHVSYLLLRVLSAVLIPVKITVSRKVKYMVGFS